MWYVFKFLMTDASSPFHYFHPIPLNPLFFGNISAHLHCFLYIYVQLVGHDVKHLDDVE